MAALRSLRTDVPVDLPFRPRTFTPALAGLLVVELLGLILIAYLVARVV
jgi:hypothetical protein